MGLINLVFKLLGNHSLKLWEIFAKIIEISQHLVLTRAKGLQYVDVNHFTKTLNILDQTSQIWFAYDDAENLESKIERCKMNED